MSRIWLVSFGFILLQAGLSFAGQSEISAALDRMAVKLTDSYRKSTGSAEKAKIAVFKFNSDKDLEKKRIGFAVSELLTHHFAGEPGFTVLERIEMTKVFDELKLNLSGAVDPDNAVKAGKFLGADALVLGSVEKLGSKYHINVRIVKADTGEVFATAYEALPSDLFEEVAKEYIVLVPSTQRIGLYGLYNWRHNSNNFSANLPFGAFYKANSFNMPMTGAGIRYYPTKKLVLDFSMMSKSHLVIGNIICSNGTSCTDILATSKSERVLISQKIDISNTFILYLGGGASYYSFGDSVYAMGLGSYYSPIIQARIEYLLQKRVGLSLSTNYDFSNKTVLGNSFGGYSVKSIILNKFSIETSISLYL